METSNLEFLPEYIYEKECCEVCGDEADNLNWDIQDNLVCPYCLENNATHE